MDAASWLPAAAWGSGLFLCPLTPDRGRSPIAARTGLGLPHGLHLCRRPAMGRRGQGQDRRSAHRRARLRRPLQRRRQRRPHRRRRRQDLQALAAAHRRPAAAHARRSSATASSSIRRASSKRSTTSRAAGIAVGDNLVVSDHAHVIFPYHMEEERLERAAAPAQAIGTTGRGIGPCYQDKVGRTYGVRVGELLHPDHLRERLRRHRRRARTACSRACPPERQPFDADAAVPTSTSATPSGCGRTSPTRRGCCTRRCEQGKRILFEAAQGSLLDVDHGTYPVRHQLEQLDRPASGAARACRRGT